MNTSDGLFCGPNGIAYDTLENMSAKYLEVHCPIPNNAIVMPPIFPLRHSQFTDEEIRRNIPNLDKDRRGDNVEASIHEALQHLVASGDHKFLAIHSFKIDDRRNNMMELAFGSDYKKRKSDEGIGNLESDFVIICKHVGLIFIECKAGPIGKAKVQFERSAKYVNWIHRFQYQIDPNLKPHQIIASGSKLSKGKSDAMMTKTKIFVKLLELDDSSTNSCSAPEDGPLYQRLSHLLTSYKTPIFDDEQYATFRNLLFGIYAVSSVGPRNPLPSSVMSQLRAAENRHIDIETQNHRIHPSKAAEKELGRLRELAITDLTSGQSARDQSMKSKALVSFEKETELLETRLIDTFNTIETVRLIMLTTDQLKVLNGSRKQVIDGQAGTGKTIVMVEKIAELLRKDRLSTVTIVAEHLSQRQIYLTLGNIAYENVRYLTTEQLNDELGLFSTEWEVIAEEIDEEIRVKRQALESKQAESFQDGTSSTSTLHVDQHAQWIETIDSISSSISHLDGTSLGLKYGHIFYDDSTTTYDQFLMLPTIFIVLRILMSKADDCHYCWIIRDYFQSEHWFYEMAQREDWFKNTNVSPSTMTQVLRYTEDVFNTIKGYQRDYKYSDRMSSFHSELLHRVPGIPTQVVDIDNDIDQITETIMQLIQRLVRHSAQDSPSVNIGPGSIAVIIADDDEHNPLFTEKKIAESLNRASIRAYRLGDIIRTGSGLPNGIFVGYDYEAVSCEWPIVLLVGFRVNYDARYFLGGSRCTTKLILVRCH